MNSPYRIFHCDVKLNIINIGKSLIEKKLNEVDVPNLILSRSNYSIKVVEPPTLTYGNTFISSTLTINYKLKVDLLKTIHENNKFGNIIGYLALKLLNLIGKRSYAVGRQICIQMAEGFRSKIDLFDKAVVVFKECSVYKLNNSQNKVLLYNIKDE